MEYVIEDSETKTNNLSLLERLTKFSTQSCVGAMVTAETIRVTWGANNMFEKYQVDIERVIGSIGFPLAEYSTVGITLFGGFVFATMACIGTGKVYDDMVKYKKKG